MCVDGEGIDQIQNAVVVVVGIEQVRNIVFIEVRRCAASRAGIGAVSGFIAVGIAVAVRVAIRVGGCASAAEINRLEDDDGAIAIDCCPNRAGEQFAVGLRRHIQRGCPKSGEQGLAVAVAIDDIITRLVQDIAINAAVKAGCQQVALHRAAKVGRGIHC